MLRAPLPGHERPQDRTPSGFTYGAPKRATERRNADATSPGPDRSCRSLSPFWTASLGDRGPADAVQDCDDRPTLTSMQPKLRVWCLVVEDVLDQGRIVPIGRRGERVSLPGAHPPP